MSRSRFLSALKKNSLASLRKKPHASSTLSVILHRENNPEPQHRYEPGGYHQILPGEIYNQQYKVIRKLGWGIYSTVWLVQDSQFVSYPWTDLIISLYSIQRPKLGRYEGFGWRFSNRREKGGLGRAWYAEGYSGERSSVIGLSSHMSVA